MPARRDEDVRLQIAFEGGQIVTALAPAAAADALEAALAGDEPVFALETEDGTYLLAVAKVVYVRRSGRETQIGFGAAS